MNKKVNLNSEILKQILRDNKPFIPPLITVFVGILLIIFIIIPQINGFMAKQQEIDVEKTRLERLQNSQSVLNSTSDTVLSKDLSIVSVALPAGKDFALILNAISSAASLSGVSLGDFDFQIGDVSKNASEGNITPFLRITLNISGSVESTIRFMSELNKSIPISEITSVKSGGNFSSVDVIFYYKPFPPQNSTDPESITALSSSEQKLIDGIQIPSSPFPDNSLSPSTSSSL